MKDSPSSEFGWTATRVRLDFVPVGDERVVFRRGHIAADSSRWVSIRRRGSLVTFLNRWQLRRTCRACSRFQARLDVQGLGDRNRVSRGLRVQRCCFCHALSCSRSASVSRRLRAALLSPSRCPSGSGAWNAASQAL